MVVRGIMKEEGLLCWEIILIGERKPVNDMIIGGLGKDKKISEERKGNENRKGAKERQSSLDE